MLGKEGAPVISNIRELATVTARGQIPRPKSIRQILGVDVGAEVAFELHEAGQIVVSRAETEHEDPAIGAFLELLAGDIRAGRHVGVFQNYLARDMFEHAQCEAGIDEDINGEADLQCCAMDGHCCFTIALSNNCAVSTTQHGTRNEAIRPGSDPMRTSGFSTH